MSTFLQSIKYITGPLTMLGFLATVFLGLYWRSVRDEKGLEYIYTLFKVKLAPKDFYELCRLAIKCAFWLILVITFLSLVAWVSVIWIEKDNPNGQSGEIILNPEIETMLRKPYIEATAYGYGKNRQEAEEAAIHNASQRLLSRIYGARITSERVISDGESIHNVITSAISGKIRGHHIIESEIDKYENSDSIQNRYEARVKLRIPISQPATVHAIGQDLRILEKSVDSFMPPTNAFTDQLEQPHGDVPYSGLIIDASGLNLQTAMAPKIHTKVGEKLRTLYSFKNIPDQVWLNRGMVEYTKNIKDAKSLLQDHIGANPLVVKAIEGYKTDAIVSNQDGLKIIKADFQNSFLEQGRVVFVID